MLEVGHAVFQNQKREGKIGKEAKVEVEAVVEAEEEIRIEKDGVDIRVEVKALKIVQKVKEVLFKLNDSIGRDMIPQSLGLEIVEDPKNLAQNLVQERSLGTDEKIKDPPDLDQGLGRENVVGGKKGNNVKENEETEKEKKENEKENGNENVKRNASVEKKSDVGKENVREKENDEKENIEKEKEEKGRKKNKELKKKEGIVKSAKHQVNRLRLKTHLLTEALTRRELQKNPGQEKNQLETILILLKGKKV